MYNDDDVFDCDKNFTDEELSDTIIPQPLDQWLFLVISPLAFFLTLLIISSFLKCSQTWKMPGDIIFFISLSEGILCIYWFSTAIYYNINQENPQSSEVFCQINSILSIFAGTEEITYNVLFFIYVRLYFKGKLTNVAKLPFKIHFLAWITMISVPLLTILFDKTGLTLFGTCSFKYPPGFPLAGIILVLLYSILAISTIIYFNKVIPNDKTYRQYKGKMVRYQYKYISAQCIIWITQAFCFTAVGLNCTYFRKGSLLIFISIGNFAKLCTPIVLSILRYSDPTILRQVQQLWGYLRQRKRTHNNSIELLEDQRNVFEDINENLKFDYVNTIEQVKLSHKKSTVLLQKMINLIQNKENLIN